MIETGPCRRRRARSARSSHPACRRLGGAERDPRGSGLERKHRGLEVHTTLREEREVLPFGQRLVTRGEHRVVVAGGGTFAASRDREHLREPEEEPRRREAPEVLARQEARETRKLGHDDHRVGEPVRVVRGDDRRLAFDQTRLAGHVDAPEDDLHDDPGEDLQESVGGRSFRRWSAHVPDGIASAGVARCTRPARRSHVQYCRFDSKETDACSRPSRPSSTTRTPRFGMVIVLLFVVAAACSSGGSSDTASSVTQPSGAALVGTHWVLSSDTDLGVPITGVVVTAMFKAGTLSGNSGCNGYTTSYKVSGSKLTVGAQIAGTRMACPPAPTAVEQEYLTRLPQVASYMIKGQKLTLEGRLGHHAPRL